MANVSHRRRARRSSVYGKQKFLPFYYWPVAAFLPVHVFSSESVWATARVITLEALPVYRVNRCRRLWLGWHPAMAITGYLVMTITLVPATGGALAIGLTRPSVALLGMALATTVAVTIVATGAGANLAH